jgi:hypothetical protein
VDLSDASAAFNSDQALLHAIEDLGDVDEGFGLDERGALDLPQATGECSLLLRHHGPQLGEDGVGARPARTRPVIRVSPTAAADRVRKAVGDIDRLPEIEIWRVPGGDVIHHDAAQWFVPDGAGFRHRSGRKSHPRFRRAPRRGTDTVLDKRSAASRKNPAGDPWGAPDSV